MYPIKDVHQIEMTSHCNLRCKYCASPNLKRPKLHMEEGVYQAALYWARHFVRAGTQYELNLAGIGESTMHPDFIRFVALAREAVGPSCRLVLATNGVNMTDEMARELVPSNPHIFVSLHRPEKAGPAVEILKKYGLLRGVSADPSISSTNWAGQVKWHVSTQASECFWVREGKVFVMADGRVSRCSFDASGIGAFTHVSENLTRLQTSPYELCKTCHMNLGIEHWNQKEGKDTRQGELLV